MPKVILTVLDELQLRTICSASTTCLLTDLISQGFHICAAKLFASSIEFLNGLINDGIYPNETCRSGHFLIGSLVHSSMEACYN